MNVRLAWAVLLAVLLAGCVPATPGDAEWREDARHALGDVAGQLSTVALTLEHHDRLIGGYARVVVTDAEEAADTATSGFEGMQPPPPEQKRFGRISDLLAVATSLLTDVRIAVVDGDTAAYPRLTERLLRQADRLHRAEARLR